MKMSPITVIIIIIIIAFFLGGLIVFGITNFFKVKNEKSQKPLIDTYEAQLDSLYDAYKARDIPRGQRLDYLQATNDSLQKVVDSLKKNVTFKIIYLKENERNFKKYQSDSLNYTDKHNLDFFSNFTSENIRPQWRDDF